MNIAWSWPLSLSCKEVASCSQAGVKMMMKISLYFLMIFEANMDKHKVKTTYFFRLINKGRERRGRGDIHWLQRIGGWRSWAHSLLHRACQEFEKNIGANQFVTEGTAAFCPLSSLERQSLSSPLASAPSSQSALSQVLRCLYVFLQISLQGKI